MCLVGFGDRSAYIDVQLWLRFDTQDGLYDIAFSEVHEHHIATASGDGSIKLWDMMLNVSILDYT